MSPGRYLESRPKLARREKQDPIELDSPIAQARPKFSTEFEAKFANRPKVDSLTKPASAEFPLDQQDSKINVESKILETEVASKKKPRGEQKSFTKQLRSFLAMDGAKSKPKKPAELNLPKPDSFVPESSAQSVSKSFGPLNADTDFGSLRSKPEEIQLASGATSAQSEVSDFETRSAVVKPIDVVEPANDFAPLRGNGLRSKPESVQLPTAVDQFVPTPSASTQIVNLESTQRSISSPVQSALDLAGDQWQAQSTQTSASKVDDASNSNLPSIRSARPVSPSAGLREPSPHHLGEAATRIPNSGSRLHPAALRSAEPQNQTLANPHQNNYIVREGDSFWSVAQAVYGDPRFFRALFKHNEKVAPDFEVLLPGTKLSTPPPAELANTFPGLCPAVDSDLVVGVEGTKSDVDSRFYLTQKGDTLFNIAAQKLNQASRYVEIYDANRVRLDSQVDAYAPLPEGVRLVLPLQ